MKAPLAIALLAACCGCDSRPPADNGAPPLERNLPSASEPDGFGAGLPPPESGNMVAPEPAPVTSEPDGFGAGAPQSNRFIVCPGDRRCPKR